MKQFARYLKYKLWTDCNAGDKHALILAVLGGAVYCWLIPENPSMWWGIIPASLFGLAILFTAFIMWVEWYHDKLCEEYGELMEYGYELWNLERDESCPEWCEAMQEVEDDLDKLQRKMYYMEILRRI
jgi:hypothetical protein